MVQIERQKIALLILAARNTVYAAGNTQLPNRLHTNVHQNNHIWRHILLLTKADKLCTECITARPIRQQVAVNGSRFLFWSFLPETTINHPAQLVNGITGSASLVAIFVGLQNSLPTTQGTRIWSARFGGTPLKGWPKNGLGSRNCTRLNDEKSAPQKRIHQIDHIGQCFYVSALQ